MKRTNLINFRRMFIVPLFLTTFFTLILGVTLFQLTSRIYKDTYTTTGKNYAEAYSLTLERNHEYEDHLLDDLYLRLVNSAEAVLERRAELSNPRLEEISELTTVDYLWWYAPDGEIIFDSKGEYVGWTPTEGDPIDTFIRMNENFYFEGIRKFTENDTYIMVLYIRDLDGYFVEAAINATNVVALLDEVSYESVINQVFESNDQVVYAYIENQSGEIVADSRSIGDQQQNETIIWRDNVLNGQTLSREIFDEYSGEKIIQIFTPVYHDNQVIEILVIGYTLESYFQFMVYTGVILGFIAFSIIALYLLLQYILVVIPLQRLSSSISTFDVKTGHYIRPLKGVKVINRLFRSVDELSTKIKDSNEENVKLNLEVNRLAYIDFLTEIPNRISLEKYLKIKIEKSVQFALIFIDIDEFKSFNDTKGHVFGDNLLISAAAVFRKLQSELNFFVARYGGDEFIIVKDYTSIAEVENVVNSIYTAFQDPILVDDSDYTIDISVGVSGFPNNGNTISDLIRKADIAMYQSKKLSNNRQVYYQDYMEETLLEEANIKETIRGALKNDGFKLVIQPQYCITTGDVISYEALARFKHYNIPPNKFILVAEKANLINSLGRVIIEKTIGVLKTMKDFGLELKPIYVNLSAKQLSDTTLIPFILRELQKQGIDSEYFGIELTESTLIDNEQFAKNFLEILGDMGIKIALDDFGSGQAGLNYLTKYPLQMVKLDRKFSINYLNKERIEVFNTLVRLAVILGFKVLAEGIEEQSQVDLLKQTEVTIIQGYVYSRPLEVDVLLSKLLEGKM